MFSIYMSFEVVYSITFKGTLLTTKGCILMLTFDMSCKILLLLKPVQTPHTTPGHVECLYNTDKFQKCTPIYNLNRPTSFAPPQLLLLNCSSSIAPPQLLLLNCSSSIALHSTTYQPQSPVLKNVSDKWRSLARNVVELYYI